MPTSSGKSPLPGIVTAVLIIIVLVTVGVTVAVMRSTDPNRATAGNSGIPTLYTDDLGVQDVRCRTSDVSIHDDVYNCGNLSPEAQVCFPSLSRGQSYCAVSPFTTQYVTATFTGPVQEIQNRDPRPWGVVLEDGRRCVVGQGGDWGVRADGHRGAYFCNGIGPEVVLSQGETPEIFDVSRDRWTAKVGELGLPGDSLPHP